MRVIVRTAGEAAHSAYPHLGRSATRDARPSARGARHARAAARRAARRDDGEHRQPRGRRGRQRGRAERRGAADGAHRRAGGRRLGTARAVDRRPRGARAQHRDPGDAARYGRRTFRRRWSRSRPTSPRCRRGERRTCSDRARSTSRIATTSMSRCRSARAADSYERIVEPVARTHVAPARRTRSETRADSERRVRLCEPDRGDSRRWTRSSKIIVKAQRVPTRRDESVMIRRSLIDARRARHRRGVLGGPDAAVGVDDRSLARRAAPYDPSAGVPRAGHYIVSSTTT